MFEEGNIDINAKDQYGNTALNKICLYKNYDNLNDDIINYNYTAIAKL